MMIPFEWIPGGDDRERCEVIGVTIGGVHAFVDSGKVWFDYWCIADFDPSWVTTKKEARDRVEKAFEKWCSKL